MPRDQHTIGWLRRRTVAVVFGDRTGLAMFLGALCLFGLLFRIDPLINDSQTVLNTLYNLGNGRLYFAEAPYGDLTTPGDHLVDGRRYGRNYGQAAFALPLLFVFRLASGLVPVQVLVVACWVVVAAGFFVCFASLTGRTRLAWGGAGGVVVLVASSLLVLPASWQGDPTVFALVASTAVAGAFCAVFVYRLLAATYDQRVAVLWGLGTVLALPVGIWSVFPKRHALVTALVLGSLWAFARSRRADLPVTRARRAHAVAYAFVGLLSWVHAAEAASLAVVLLLVDVPTARHTDLRTVVTVGVTFLLASTPTLLTNFAISGNPIQPPRLLPEFAPGPEPGVSGGVSGGSGGGGSNPVVMLANRYLRGLGVLGDPVRVQHVLVWSGTSWQRVFFPPFQPGTNLSLFESAPVLGGLAAAVGVAIRRLRQFRTAAVESAAGWRLPPAVWYALLSAVSLLLVYLPSLPLRVQLTARYLLPVFPLLFVVTAHVAVVREAVTTHTATLGRVYALTVLSAGVGVPAVGVALDLGLGGVFLLQAALNLLGWGVLVVVSVLAGFRGRATVWLAAALALAAGLGTALVLDIGLVYVHHGPSLLPSVEAGSRWVWERFLFG